MFLALVLLFGLAIHFISKYKQGQYAINKLDYIYDRAYENKNLQQGLKWIDQEIEAIWDLLYEQDYRYP